MRFLVFSAYVTLAIVNGHSALERSDGLEMANHDNTSKARRGGDETRLVSLADSLAPLRDRFNVDKGKPRLVALLSPT